MIRRVEELFRRQLEAWPLLKKGVAGLAESKTRRVRAFGHEVLVRHIPHRAKSTTAAVDSESVSKRPCFLCAENLYPEQEGLAFAPDHTIYCNPFPVVERHVTVVHREHRPQRIDGQVGAMLDLAAALPGFFVVYNGPECGASAPDHMHLQAGSRDGLPILDDTATMPGPAIEIYGERALLLRGKDRSRLVDETARALAILSSVTGKAPEPLCNVAVFGSGALRGRAPGPQAGPTGPSGQDTGLSVVLFPRSKHRPDVFHTGELTVSPAAIDLCGILVVPLAKDFERISGEDVGAVLREVTLADDQFSEVVDRLRGEPGLGGR